FPTPTDQPQLARYSICGGSPRIIQGKPQLWTPTLGNILHCLKNRLASVSTPANSEIAHLPFIGGWLGWLGYDLAWEIENLPYTNPNPLPFPVAYWYEPETFAVLDHVQQTLWLAASKPNDLDRMKQHLETAEHKNIQPTPPFLRGSPMGNLERNSSLGKGGLGGVKPASQLTFLSSQTDYEKAVRQAKKYIQAGDIFQTNLSLRFQATTNVNSWTLYRHLQQINPSPFASYWQTPWGAMISCSPERLVQLQGKQAQTRPIAGTRARGKTPELDQQLAQELLSNTKERAEHIMLVDLERNDLGRVCQWGSVEVNELLTIERYSHVMHLVSNVRGTLQDSYDAVDLIRAFFPGGTITGCPKVRCMEIIEELEPVRRSLFYGSCGYLDLRGNLDLNILIRTLLYTTPTPNQASHVWGQVGAGIVADSDPEKEWYESLHKAEAQLAALRLAETNGINLR
ncbi:MAG: aminodeoxychorismate synthase, component I, partial [Cyanobacteriota bacterium]